MVVATNQVLDTARTRSGQFEVPATGDFESEILAGFLRDSVMHRCVRYCNCNERPAIYAATQSGLSHRDRDLPACGGKLRVVASIEEPQVIERILNHLGRDSESLNLTHPSRAPPPRGLPI